MHFPLLLPKFPPLALKLLKLLLILLKELFFFNSLPLNNPQPLNKA